MARLLPDSYEIDVMYHLTVEDDFSCVLRIEDILPLVNCVCRNADKWFAAFGKPFPIIPVNREIFENGEIKVTHCPVCGTYFPDPAVKAVEDSVRNGHFKLINNISSIIMNA